MRLIVVLCVAAFATLAGFRCADAIPTSSLDMRADRVEYYSNRYIVRGAGHVRIRLSDGTMLSSELFTMDLKLNRYLLAGNVHLDSGNVHEVGAALAGYPDLDRIFFLSAHGDPDKWTFFGSNFTDQHRGRQQPGDAYLIPDLGAERPYIKARSAMIIPKTNIKFSDAQLHVGGNSVGVYVPTYSWVEQFSANPNYQQNAFAGASFDIGIPFNGSLHAVSAFHIRYSGMNHFFLSFDQHFVWGRDYIVFSINPLTNEERQYNLIAYKRISPKMEARVFVQESAAQRGIIYQPQVAAAYENLQYVFSAPHSAFLLTGDNYNTSLLQYPANSTIADEATYDHPSDAQISWLGRATQINKLPIAFSLRSGYGNAHDGYHCGRPAALSGCGFTPDRGYVLQYFGADATRVPTIWQHFAGITLFTQSISLDGVKRSLNFNATFDKQRQWFSLPHYIDTTTTNLSLSKLYLNKLAVVAAYSVSNLGDYYGARQLEFYPPYAPVVFNGSTNITYTGYNAFRGISTTRAWTVSNVFTPNQYFNYAVTLRRGFDFPAPIPGLFGNAPWQLTNEVRVRIAKHILADATRVDYFRWGGYEPSFVLQFGP